MRPSTPIRRLRACPLLALLVLGTLTASPVLGDDAARAERELRRHEWIVVLRARNDAPASVPAAEVAALRAGGAVLERIRFDATEAWTEHRMLLRTRSAEALGRVLEAVRATPGILGASVRKLPDVATGLGSPTFMSVYMVDSPQETHRGGIVVRHDVPEVIDKRDLLEVVDVPFSPSPTDPTVGGGFSLNVSEIIQHFKEASWRRREQRMKDARLPILPPDGHSAVAGR